MNEIQVACTVSMAFFKVAVRKPMITIPLPSGAGNGVPVP
jgi:hypothetical protein